MLNTNSSLKAYGKFFTKTVFAGFCPNFCTLSNENQYIREGYPLPNEHNQDFTPLRKAYEAPRSNAQFFVFLSENVSVVKYLSLERVVVFDKSLPCVVAKTENLSTAPCVGNGSYHFLAGGSALAGISADDQGYEQVFAALRGAELAL